MFIKSTLRSYDRDNKFSLLVKDFRNWFAFRWGFCCKWRWVRNEQKTGQKTVSIVTLNNDSSAQKSNEQGSCSNETNPNLIKSLIMLEHYIQYIQEQYTKTVWKHSSRGFRINQIIHFNDSFREKSVAID